MPRGDNKYKWKQTYKPPPLRRIQYEENSNRSNGNDVKMQIRFQNDRQRSKRYPRSQVSEQTWYKIMVPHGAKIGKAQLLNLLQQSIATPMNAVYVHFQANTLVFWVEFFEVYRQLTNLSYKLKSPEGFKLKILGVKDKAPNPPELETSYAEKLKDAMSGRYNITLKQLNLSDFSNDMNLKNQSIHMPLFRINVMREVINIIEKNIPQVEEIDLSLNRLSFLYPISSLGVKAKHIKCLSLANNQIKSEGELNKIRNLKLKKLSLVGNPIVKYFSDTDSYISAIRKIFPDLEVLDEKELPKIIKFDLEETICIPKRQPSSLVNNEIKTLIQTFIQQYYQLYDSKNRIELLQAYDENAYFSMGAGSTPASYQNRRHSDLKAYINNSRNLERVRDKDKRLKLMHEGSNKIVSFLTLLPETKHKFDTFTTDVVLYTNSLLVFALTGLFKETETNSIRYFTRTFHTIPFGAGVKIINDMLYIMAPTQEMIQNFVKPKDESPSVQPNVASEQPTTSHHPLPHQLQPLTQPATNAYPPLNFAHASHSLHQLPPHQTSMYVGHHYIPNNHSSLLPTPNIPINLEAFKQPNTLNTFPIDQSQTQMAHGVTVPPSHSHGTPIIPIIPSANHVLQTGQPIIPHNPPHPNTSNQEQQHAEMLKAFITATGMNPAWARKCLQDNDWDYAPALSNFTSCKAEGVIPPEAFAPI